MADEEDKPPAPPVRLTSANRLWVLSTVLFIFCSNTDLGSCRNEAIPVVPVDLRPLPKEPEPDKKKTLKVKVHPKKNKEDSKPNISYPTNFEHTVHVGFDAVTGEFTVSAPIYITHEREQFFRLLPSVEAWPVSFNPPGNPGVSHIFPDFPIFACYWHNALILEKVKEMITNRSCTSYQTLAVKITDLDAR